MFGLLFYKRESLIYFYAAHWLSMNSRAYPLWSTFQL
nr:MAG TPA: hypothetical protein [Caudoviricetes sp.]